MRKLIEYCLISVDGFVLDDPFPFSDYKDENYLRERLGIFSACDALLLGRTTYERFAKLSPPNEHIHAYAARLNAIQKYVFSSKLETADWSPSTIVHGDVVTEVTKLKQQNGGNLLILGHGRLGQTLLERRLLDSIELAIYPVLVGHGRPFFRDGQVAELKLAATKTFSKIVKLCYEPRY
jgi:dihydrofolate reductase